MRQLKGIGEPGLLRALDSAENVLILGHISPDGDCVGSMLALGAVLKKRGKTVFLCLQDPVPGNLRFLPGAESILPPGQLEGERFDLGVAVDCADEGRMGKAARLFRLCPATAQIDHHATNPRYAGVNEVDGKASCAGCMIWRLMGEYHMEPDREIAECLYSAISTDTGRFCFSCTDEETFLCAASVAAAGIDINRCAREIHLLKEAPHLKLLGRSLDSLSFFAGGRCASMVIGAEDYAASGASREHADGIINYALNIPGVKMACFADISDPDALRISFRAVEPCHVNDIAALFGGGGHALAAGCRTGGDPREILCRAREAMEAQVREMTDGME